MDTGKLNFGDLFGQLGNLQEQFAKSQTEMEKITVEASSGGGMVTVNMNGLQKITSIKIDPLVVNPEDITMLQDLVQAAVNEAVEKTRSLMTNQVKQMFGDLPFGM